MDSVKRTAAERLFKNYSESIYRYCYYCLGNAEHAEDAVSQVFAKVVDAPALPISGSVRAWIFAITHNVAVSMRRSTLTDLASGVVVELEDPSPGPFEQLTLDDRRHTLNDIVCRLTEEQQEVVWFRVAGLSTAEIATQLGRTQGEIRTIYRGACLRLRNLLADSDFDA